MKLIWSVAVSVWLFVLGISSLQMSAPKTRPNGNFVTVPIQFKDDSKTKPDEPNKVVLMLAGDVMPGRMINVKLQESGNFDYPFINNLFAGADWVFVNLESPVIENCPKRYEGFRFCADIRIVPAMAKAGVGIVNLANNHIGNEGMEGIRQTKQILQTNQIKYTGTNEDVIIEKNGLRLGFLGFNDVGACPAGIDCAIISNIEDRISKLSHSVDFVVVQFHWGVEYVNKHNKRQQTLAYKAIDAGADLVVGAHPHWVQDIELYKDKLIVYSLGNFLFDQQWSRETQEGVLGRFEITNQGLMNYSFLPIIVDKSYQPRFANDAEGQKILKRMGL